MSYVGKQVTASQINFLASAKYTSFQTMVDDTNAAVITDDLGHKVIPAGTILPANDATAQGITTDEVDVSNGGQLVGLIVEGWLYAKRLPVAPSADAITAMSTIHFKDADTGTSDPKADGGSTTPSNPSEVDVTSVTLDQETLTGQVGGSGTLVATVAPDDATNKTVTWTSSDETVATVDASGVVTFVKVGTATITAEADGQSATSTVTVTDAA